MTWFPAVFSRDYVSAKHKRTGKEKEDGQFVEISGAGHFDVIDPSTRAWKIVERTVLELLA